MTTSRSPRLLHQSIQSLCVQLAVLAFALVNSAVIARWLGPEGKGQLSLAMLFVSILALLLGGGLNAAITYFAGSRRATIADLSGNSIGFGLLASAVGVAAAAMLQGAGLFERVLPGVPGWLLGLAILSLPLALPGGYLSGLLLGVQRIGSVNAVNLAQGAASTLLLTALVVGLDGGVGAAAAALITAAAGALVALGVLVRRLGGSLRPRLQREVLQPMLSYAMRANLGNVLQFFNYRLDVFVVNYLLGAEQVGIYGVAVSLAELLWQWPQAVSFALFPRATASDPEQMNRLTPRVLRWTLLVTLLGAIGLALVGALVIRFVFGERFAGAYGPMLILLPGVVLLGGGKVLGSDIAGRGHPGLNSLNSAAALVVTLAGNVALVPRFGIAGAALASSIAYALNFLLAVAFFLRVRRQPRG